MGAHDFDFYYGRWHVVNRRLVERLRGSNEWDTFDAISDCSALPRGLGNMDHFVTDYWPGFAACTLRIFNPHTQQWSLNWADNRSGVLFPPVVGAFKDGVGVFEGDDHHEGIPVRARFIWSHITPLSVRWEQAFSTDGGQTWEVNWVMESTRE